MSFSRFANKKIFLVLVAWRLTSVFIVQTSHVPDEYWQSLEVAHKQTFDYGYLTWEWRYGIRSYLYPYLISILYFLLKCLKFDNVTLLIVLPRIFQALLSAYSDYIFYLWSGSKYALLNLCLNWYWYYCATRTLINTFETCLTITALYQYPWKSCSENRSNFLWIVSFLCFIRPTAAVVWFPLCLYHLSRNKYNFFSYLLIGTICLIVCTTVDTICYGKFILTPWEFFKVNVLNSVSEQYGKMSLHWYFTSGLPVLLGINYIMLPLVLYKAFKNYTQSFKSAILGFTALWTKDEKSLDEICEALDDLTIKNLELMEEKISLTVQLENTIRQGHIDLAKARYIRGRETIGLLQIPYETSDIKTLFDLETTYEKEEKTEGKNMPIFDISLKKSKEGEEELQDPIKWFGVLVPQSLKSAQKHFQDALFLSVRLANIQSELAKVNSESDSLRLFKKAAT